MRKLSCFLSVSLDGYFVDRHGQMDWAKVGTDDKEFADFSASNARGESDLVFGRVTYDMMSRFWPSPQAKELFPEVAEGMHKAHKFVFSRTLDKPDWNHTKLVKGELVPEMRRMKEEDGNPLVILGSGSLVAQLAPHRLIDEYQMVMVPVALGAGRTIFDGLKENLSLKLFKSRTFLNGRVLLSYRP